MNKYANLIVVSVAIGFLLAAAIVAIFIARFGSEQISNTLQDDQHLGTSVKDSDLAEVANGMSSGSVVREFMERYGRIMPVKVCTPGCPDGTYDFAEILDSYSDGYVQDTAEFGCLVHRDEVHGNPDAVAFYQAGMQSPTFAPGEIDGALQRLNGEAALIEAQYKAYQGLHNLKEKAYEKADTDKFNAGQTEDWLRNQAEALAPSGL